MSVLSIDASALNGVNQSTYIADFFAPLSGGASHYYGGTPDSAFGGTYYVNGTQVLFDYDESDGAGGTQTSDQVAILGGEEIAYDFIHHGAQYGHGITGWADSVTFGTWVEGVTTGTEGIGEAGEISGLDTGLVIEGFDLTAAVGAGPNLETNPVYALYKAVQLGDAQAIYDLISTYDLEVTGSTGGDTLNGYGGSDVLLGLGGDDVLVRSAGADILLGGTGADTLAGGSGNDDLRGGSGNDVLTGGAGRDHLTGGAGADTFIIKTQSGLDIVSDFKVGTDVIDLTDLDLAGFGDLTVTGVGNHVDVTIGSVTLQLNGLEAADVTADLFLF